MAYRPPALASHGNILKIRILRGHSASRGAGLDKFGMQTTVLAEHEREIINIR